MHPNPRRPRPGGFLTKPGATPDYSKGLFVTPKEANEWQPGADLYPRTEEDCGKGNTFVYYSPLDDKGRAQGVEACLNDGDFTYVDEWTQKTGELSNDSAIVGSPVPRPQRDYPELTPPGFRKGMNRGHLLANQLGGTGTDRRNLVSLWATPNNSQMKKVENNVARMVAAGQTVHYQVGAHYTGSGGAPDYLSITWANLTTGANSGGPITIWNTPTGLEP